MSGAWGGWPVLLAVQLVAATLMWGSRLEVRERFTRRLAAVLALVAVVALLPSATGLLAQLSDTEDYLNQFLMFSCILAVLVMAVRYLFEANLWASLFCATAAYATQNLGSSAEQLARMLFLGRPAELDAPEANAAGLLAVVVAYVLCYAVLVRRIERSSLERMRSRAMIAVFVIVAFAVIGFDLVVKSACNDGLSLGNALLLRVTHILVCVFVLLSEYEILYVQQLRVEKATADQLLAARERQYELARGNIEAINVKCHDLRHQIRALADGGAAVDRGALDDLAREVSIYDSAVKTGNDALDTILTEKSLVCERRGITLSRIVDGASLDFVAPSDLYAFFGNLLDNAIEAVSSLDDLDRRSISLVVKRHGTMVTIHEENYYEGELSFLDGLPRTTKGDELNHGFGTRSMRLIAEKYEGSLVIGAQRHIFRLDAVIPLPA